MEINLDAVRASGAGINRDAVTSDESDEAGPKALPVSNGASSRQPLETTSV